MILEDPEHGPSSKLAPASSPPALRLPEAVAGRSASPLPDYETSQAQHDIIFRKPSFPQRFDSRFWRWTFFALALYVFLSVVIGIPLIATRIAYRRSHPPMELKGLFLDTGDDQAAMPYMPVKGGMLMANTSVACDDWDSMIMAGDLYQATAHSTLPASGFISIRSNATNEVVPHPGGMHNLTVDINDDPTQTRVVFDLTLTTSSAALRDQVHICFNTASDDPNRGLSIYPPQHLSATDVLAFDIRVLFPQSSKLIKLSNLVTYLPMFDQYFGPLSPRVYAQNINIAGAGLDILCDSLRADKLAVKTSFASISGTFNVTQSLKLDNIEGSIRSNITLNNDPSYGLPTVLTLDTGNSDIAADVVLVAPPSSYAPVYRGHVQTFNGSLSLNVSHGAGTQPAMLDLHVENNQAPTAVRLDSKFAGMFGLQTKLSWVQVGHEQNLSDPTGQGRQWNIDVDSQSTSTIHGWLGFGTRPAKVMPHMVGNVMLSSSLSSISLQIGS